MRRALLPLLLFAAPVAAQFGFDEPASHASATYYQRVDGPWVRVALEVSVAEGWHLYHTELGAPNAAGVATALEVLGEGIEWSELRMPEPHRDEQVGPLVAEDDGDRLREPGHAAGRVRRVEEERPR